MTVLRGSYKSRLVSVGREGFQVDTSQGGEWFQRGTA